MRRGACLTIVALASACGGQPREASTLGAPLVDAGATRSAEAACSGDGAQHLLAGHAAAFGGVETVLRSLPRRLAGKLEVGDAAGTIEIRVTREGSSLLAKTAAFEVGSGVDPAGPWDYGLNGVVARLRADEAQPIALDDWLLRRAYLNDAKAARLRCDAGRAVLAFDAPEVGLPLLGFDWASARLETVSARKADGGA